MCYVQAHHKFPSDDSQALNSFSEKKIMPLNIQASRYSKQLLDLKHIQRTITKKKNSLSREPSKAYKSYEPQNLSFSSNMNVLYCILI